MSELEASSGLVMMGPTNLRWAQQALCGADALALSMRIEPYAGSLAENRRREFLAGRIAAARALQAANAAVCSVPRAANGAPIWPDGWCGSITHDGDVAIAAVAPDVELRAIGIDLQAAISDRTDAALAVRRYALSPDDADMPLTMLFAIKEAAYKCLSALSIERSLKDLRVANTSQLCVLGSALHVQAATQLWGDGRVLAIAWVARN